MFSFFGVYSNKLEKKIEKFLLDIDYGMVSFGIFGNEVTIAALGVAVISPRFFGFTV